MDINQHQTFRMTLMGDALRRVDHITELLDRLIYMLAAHFGAKGVSWKAGSSPLFELSFATINDGPTIVIKLIGIPETDNDKEKIGDFLKNIEKYCAGTQGYKEFVVQMKRYGYDVLVQLWTEGTLIYTGFVVTVN